MAHDGDCEVYGCERVLESVDDQGIRVARCRKCGQASVFVPPKPSSTDARAQLWIRVYAVEYETARRGPDISARARETAAAHFDEHYLGAKR